MDIIGKVSSQGPFVRLSRSNTQRIRLIVRYGYDAFSRATCIWMNLSGACLYGSSQTALSKLPQTTHTFLFHTGRQMSFNVPALSLKPRDTNTNVQQNYNMNTKYGGKYVL